MYLFSGLHVLRSRTYFRRCRVRRIPFSCFALLNMFSAVPSALGPVFMFCAAGLIFSGPEGDGSHFQVLRDGTRFRRYRGRRVLFSCFALSDSFSAVPRASGPVLMFCAPGLIFGGIEGVQSHFHVLRSRTCFRRCRVHRVTFSYFACPDSFSAVPRASGLVFFFLRARARFRRYRACRVPFSCFALPESFPAILRASGPIFMFCAPGLIFGGT
jgi:hypothetical protein